MLVFTTSRGTFAFAAESLGLFHFLPSFFSSLSSLLKSRRFYENGGSAEERVGGREGEV